MKLVLQDQYPYSVLAYFVTENLTDYIKADCIKALTFSGVGFVVEIKPLTTCTIYQGGK